MTYVVEPWNDEQPLGAVLAKTAAEEFRTLKKYITKIPHKEISADYTFVQSDVGKRIVHPTTDTFARVWTVPPNSAVSFAIGSVISVGVRNGAGSVTLTQGAGVTLRRAGTGVTGDLTVAVNGWMTLEKVATDEWYVYGSNLFG